MTLSDEEIERLNGLSEDALLAELGRAVLKHNQPGLRARPPSIKKLIEEAKAWLAAENEKVRQAVCRNEKIRTIATTEPGATVKLMRTVADVVGGVVVYLPAGTVTEIIMRDGIPKYCEHIWAEEN